MSICPIYNNVCLCRKSTLTGYTKTELVEYCILLEQDVKGCAEYNTSSDGVLWDSTSREGE